MITRPILVLALAPSVLFAQEHAETNDVRLAQWSARIGHHFDVLAAAEWRHYSTHLHFTSSVVDGVSELANDGFATVFLEASDSGWSAVVLSDSLPGTACGTYSGKVAAPNHQPAGPGEIVCTGDEAGLVRPGPVALRVTHMLLASDPSLDSPPRVAECPEVDLPKELRQPLQRVHMIVVIDQDGTISPAPIRLLQAPSFRHAAAAIVLAEQCRWRPGYRDRQAQRTAARLPDILGKDMSVPDSLP